jgi:hypothetical protein
MELYNQLNEMASLLGPDADPEDEKKILNRIKVMRTLSGKVDFERAINGILERVNRIRHSNGLETIDRSELLSKTMKQDVLRDIKEKKKTDRIQKKEETKKLKEKEQEVLLKYVPVKLENTVAELKYSFDVYKREKTIKRYYISIFNGKHYGKPFTIEITTGSLYLDKIEWKIETGGHGKVVEINKGNIVGEVRFPAGEKYKYGTKIIFKYKPPNKRSIAYNGSIIAKVVKL